MAQDEPAAKPAPSPRAKEKAQPKPKSLPKLKAQNKAKSKPAATPKAKQTSTVMKRPAAAEQPEGEDSAGTPVAEKAEELVAPGNPAPRKPALKKPKEANNSVEGDDPTPEDKPTAAKKRKAQVDPEGRVLPSSSTICQRSALSVIA